MAGRSTPGGAIAEHAFPASAIPADVGAVVWAERRERRMTQARLATRAGLSRASIYRLENRTAQPTANTLFHVAHALGISIRELVPDWPEWDPVSANGHGEAVRERRRALNLSLAELARRVGVSESSLSRHERGLAVSPMLLRRVGDDLVACNDRLAQALGFVDAGELERHVHR